MAVKIFTRKCDFNTFILLSARHSHLFYNCSEIIMGKYVWKKYFAKGDHSATAKAKRIDENSRRG